MVTFDTLVIYALLLACLFNVVFSLFVRGGVMWGSHGYP